MYTQRLKLKHAMGFSDVPLEIVDQILGYLILPDNKQNKKLVLANLAGCNVAFNAWAAPRLFKELVVRVRADDTSLEQFHQILDDRPAIGNLIKSLTLQIDILSTDETHQIYRDIHLPAILPLLQSLKHFALKAGSLPVYSPIDWDLLSKSSSEALQNICLLPSITQVEICNSCFMKSGWITRFTNLQELTIWGILDSFSKPGGNYPWQELDPAFAPRPTRLRLDAIPACIDALYNMGALTTLKRLEVALRREQYVGTVRGIIEGASDTLEELSIYRFNESPFSQMEFYLSTWTPLPALLHLTIGISYAYIFDEVSHWAIYVDSFLRGFPRSCPALNTITLIAGPYWRYLGPPKIYIPTDIWITLEQFCATRYPTLRKLVLIFEDSSVPSPDISDCSSSGSEGWPGDVPYTGYEHDRDQAWEGVMDASDKLGITSFTVLVEVKSPMTHL